MNSIKILTEEVFADEAIIVDIFGQGCNYPTKKGISEFGCAFKIEATNKKFLKKIFNVVYQTEERTDNMFYYSGFGMTTASKFGVEDDESSELEEFLDYEDNALDVLLERAEMLSKEYFETMLSEE